MMNVRLKNGTHGREDEVTQVMLIIGEVAKNAAMDMWTLVYLCRGEDAYQYPEGIARLKRAGLVESDGSVRDIVRNVVVSGAVGEDRGMKFEDPIAA
jgi:hypothetical protein